MVLLFLKLVLSAITTLFVCGGFAVLSRMVGGGHKPLPYGLNEWLISLPVFMVAQTISHLEMSWYLSLTVSLVCYGLAVLSFRLGHGQYFDPYLRRNTEYREPEKIDFIVSWLYGTDPKTIEDKEVRDYEISIYHPSMYYYRCMFGLFLTGLVAFIGLIPLAIYTDHLWLAASLILFSVYKPVAYSLGWETFLEDNHLNLNHGTEYGEYYRGVLYILPLITFLLALTLFL